MCNFLDSIYFHRQTHTHIFAMGSTNSHISLRSEKLIFGNMFVSSLQKFLDFHSPEPWCLVVVGFCWLRGMLEMLNSGRSSALLFTRSCCMRNMPKNEGCSMPVPLWFQDPQHLRATVRPDLHRAMSPCHLTIILLVNPLVNPVISCHIQGFQCRRGTQEERGWQGSRGLATPKPFISCHAGLDPAEGCHIWTIVLRFVLFL